MASESTAQEKLRLYLIPGMATDCRVFKGFDLQNYDVVCIQWVEFQTSESLREYAIELAKQIDTTRPFALAGVSMGGMLASEIARTHEPEFLALISSAESTEELPWLYHMAKWLPLHHLNNEFFLSIYLKMPLAMRGVDEKSDRKLYLQMIRDTGVKFMNWQIDKIIRWGGMEKDAINCPIHSIHGKKDKVIPISKNRSYTRIVENASHKMVINQPEVIAKWLDGIVGSGQ